MAFAFNRMNILLVHNRRKMKIFIIYWEIINDNVFVLFGDADCSLLQTNQNLWIPHDTPCTLAVYLGRML